MVGLGASKYWVGAFLKGGHNDFLLPAFFLPPTPSIFPSSPSIPLPTPTSFGWVLFKLVIYAFLISY